MSKIKAEKFVAEEIPVKEEVKINLDAFASLSGMSWQIKSRLEYHLIANKLPSEHTVDQWKKLLSKV